MYSRYIPYLKSNRKYRKDSFIRVKNEIRDNARILGGKFTTHDYIHGQNGWVDFYFLSKKGRYFYNAVIHTARTKIRDELMHLAFDESEKICPSPPFEFERIPGKEDLWQIKNNDEYERTFFPNGRVAWCIENEPRLLEKSNFQIFEEITKHFDYRFGIGLHITIDSPGIDINTINDFIDSFWVADEVEYRANEPVLYDNSILELPAVCSNALCNPKDWPHEDEISEI